MLLIMFRLLIALFLGMLPAFWLLQHDERVQQATATKLVSMLEEMWKAKIDVKNARVNLLGGKMHFYHGHVRSIDSSDHEWQFDECHVDISRFNILFNNRIDIYLLFTNLKAKTLYINNKLSIVDHISNIFLTPPTNPPLKLCSMTAPNMQLSIIKDNHEHLLQGSTQLFLKKTNDDKFWTGTIGFTKGSLLTDNTLIIPTLHGATDLTINCSTEKWQALTHYNFNLANAQSKDMYTLHLNSTPEKHMANIMRGNNVSFSITSQNNNVAIKSHTTSDELIKLYSAWSLIQKSPTLTSLPNIQGTVDADLSITSSPSIALNGNVTLTNVLMPSLGSANAQIFLKQNGENLTADLDVSANKKTKIKGKVSWSWKTLTGNATLKNVTSLPISSFATIKTDHFKTTINLSAQKGIEGTFRSILTSPETKKYKTHGRFLIDSSKAHLAGTAHKIHYSLDLSLSPLFVSNCQLIQDKNKLIDLSTDATSLALHGSIHASLIRAVCPESLSPHILGNTGQAHINIDQHAYPTIKGTINFDRGNLHFLGGLNVFTHGSSSFNFDLATRKFILEDLTFNLYKGKIYSPRLIVELDNFYSPSFVHIPLQVDSTLVNWKQDLYALVYGNVVMTKHAVTPLHVSGHIVLKKSLLKENIFSEKLSSNTYVPSYTADKDTRSTLVDLLVQTESPLKVKTPFLDALSSLDLHLHLVHHGGDFLSPRLKGKIKLERGSLNFTRNKLWISNAVLRFVPNQVNDMYLDLTAQNKIKKYWVTLTAHGNVQKPTISLESSPTLSEEQILALLFAGSENTSLQTDFPQILMQNLHQVIMGSKQVLPKATSFFQKITKPLKYIQIAPNFTDQSGRGGVRGTVSIDVNQQLHAQIQKNFNLQEDFAFQVEYFLLDDLNFKLIKDQRGELGTEVEVRIKL